MSSGKPHVTVYIRTYHGDLAWLPYALRSVCMFGGDVVTSVVVAYPDVDAAIIQPFLAATFPWARSVATNTTAVFREAMMRPLDATKPLDAGLMKWRLGRYGTADADAIVRANKMAHPGYVNGFATACRHQSDIARIAVARVCSSGGNVAAVECQHGRSLVLCVVCMCVRYHWTWCVCV